jgi:hypothetical protein
LFFLMEHSFGSRVVVPPQKGIAMSFRNRTDTYRMKALVCQQRATESSDPTSKQDWEELAIEWHNMANFAERTSDEAVVVEMV